MGSFNHAAALIAIMALGACKEELKSDKLVEFVTENEISSNSAYWFELHNTFGEWEKTILVFGYWDNEQECSWLLEKSRLETPQRSFRCEAAR